MEKTIICIGREYGSGGHEIGELLAKRTGYAFYDKEKLLDRKSTRLNSSHPSSSRMPSSA